MISLLLVPYHLGVERVHMGLGPERILQAGIHRELSARGHDVAIEFTLRPKRTALTEDTAVIEINKLLARQVRDALAQQRFPMVLAGNCNACLGVLAGIATMPIGIIWLDAHGDFNTPETSASGFLDGMSLAMATGLCYRKFWAETGSSPASGVQVVHIGGHDFDHGEEERLIKQRICAVSANQLRQAGLTTALHPALVALQSQVHRVYLHVDLDVLDPAEAQANEFAVPGGLSLHQLKCVIQMVGGAFDIQAATLTAYDPTCDQDKRALSASLQVIHTIVDIVAHNVCKRESSSKLNGLP
ncbi:MAG: arginase family protein [Chloroflexi bacterium]|nr:arginase family protein [Chloroflexota bacterium]